MRLATLLIVQFSVVGWNNARAQCPDGSPPPCRSGLARGHVTIDSDAVAILPFRVRGPPGEVEWLREGIVDWLNIALDGLAGWRVVHPRTLLLRAPARAELMDIPAASRTAREVGAASLIVGSAFASGTQLRLHAELYDAVATRRLATVEARAPTADPAPGVDSLAVGLARQRLLSHRPTTRRSVEEYATTSPQALRAYLASEHLARQGAWQAAADSLLTAIGYDSTFGLAYYRLYIAGTFGAVPRGWQSPEIIRAALRHLDRLPQRQRDLLLTVHAQQSGIRTEAIRRADDLGRRYPDDAEAAYIQGESYFHFGLASGERPDEALEPFERALDRDPSLVEPYNHAIELRCLVGDTARAWRLMTRLVKVAPEFFIGRALNLAMRAGLRGEDPANLSRALRLSGIRDAETILDRTQVEALRALAGQPGRALAVADSFAALMTEPDLPQTERIQALLRRSLYHLTRGRYAEAWKMLQRAATIEPGNPDVLASAAVYALVTRKHTGEGRAAAGQLGAADSSAPTARTLVAWEAAEDGDTARLATLLGVGEPAGPADFARVYREAHRAGLWGLLDLVRGDTTAAGQKLEEAYRIRPYGYRGQGIFPGVGYADIALDAYLSLAWAQLESRVVSAEAALRLVDDAALVPDHGIPYGAQAEELRGQIAELQRDTAAAIRAYRTFIELWSDADPELQPRVAAARAARARLEGRRDAR